MKPIPPSERKTQDRVIELFRQEPGYRYLGNWMDREGNHCIEEGLFAAWQADRGRMPFNRNVRSTRCVRRWSNRGKRNTPFGEIGNDLFLKPLPFPVSTAVPGVSAANTAFRYHHAGKKSHQWDISIQFIHRASHILHQTCLTRYF